MKRLGSPLASLRILIPSKKYAVAFEALSGSVPGAICPTCPLGGANGRAPTFQSLFVVEQRSVIDEDVADEHGELERRYCDDKNTQPNKQNYHTTE